MSSPRADGPSKLTSLADACRLIPDGASVTFGGVLLNRAPAAFVRELARQRRRGLRLVKPSPADDLDLLSAAGGPPGAGSRIPPLARPFGHGPDLRRRGRRGTL